MKFRNKKTGEVFESFRRGGPIDLYFYLNKYEENEVDRKTYQSLAELNDEWEDYAPKEPLIKDEKVRKAVRAWAEANRVIEARYSSCHDAECEFNGRDDENKSIVFIGNFTEMNKELDYSGRTIYTIAELCGEEEE